MYVHSNVFKKQTFKKHMIAQLKAMKAYGLLFITKFSQL